MLGGLEYRGIATAIKRVLGAANGLGASLIGFIQPSAGAVSRSLLSKVREIELSVFDFLIESERTAVTTKTGADITTNLMKWRAAAAALTTAGWSVTSKFPPGLYCHKNQNFMKGVGGKIIADGAQFKNLNSAMAQNFDTIACSGNAGTFDKYGTVVPIVHSYFYGYLIGTTPTATSGGLEVIEIPVTAGGSGYVSAPTVSFSGGGGAGAAATANIDNGIVQSITVTNPGSGYTSAPAVAFSSGAAAAVAILGVISVTTTTPAEAGNFAAGQWAMVYGFGSMDNSYPPRPRFFEYVKVASADAATGRVILDRPLSNRYRSDWWDFVSTTTSGRGKARIIPLTRDDFKFVEYLEIQGAEFLENDNYAKGSGSIGGNYQGVGYYTLKLKNVKGANFIPSMCHTIITEDCQFVDCEADKVTVSWTDYRSTFTGAVTQGTGIDYMTFNETDFRGLTQPGAVLCTTFDKAKFRGRNTNPATTVVGLPSGSMMRSIVHRDCSYYVSNPLIVNLVLEGTAVNSATVSASVAPTASLFLIDVANDTAAKNVLQWLQKGQWMRTNNLATFVLVKDVYAYDATHLGVEIETNGTVLVAGDVLYYFNTERFAVERPNVYGPYAPLVGFPIRLPRTPFIFVPKWSGNEVEQTIVITERDIPWPASGGAAAQLQIYPHGWLRHWELDVHTPYTGATGTCRLQLKEQDYAGVLTTLTGANSIDLKTGGVRWADAQRPLMLTGTATYDPPNLADGVGATTTVPVTGAALGDEASATFSLDLQGITVTAWVSSANTVSVRFQNESGGALDLASGTLTGFVRKPIGTPNLLGVDSAWAVNPVAADFSRPMRGMTFAITASGGLFPAYTDESQLYRFTMRMDVVRRKGR